MREELSYVVPLGLPHSQFLSWSEDDQDKALAYLREMGKVCSGCGTRKEQWEEDKFAFVGWTEKCPGCELMEMERDNIPEKTLGVKVGLMRRDIAEVLMEQGEGML